MEWFQQAIYRDVNVRTQCVTELNMEFNTPVYNNKCNSSSCQTNLLQRTNKCHFSYCTDWPSLFCMVQLPTDSKWHSSGTWCHLVWYMGTNCRAWRSRKPLSWHPPLSEPRPSHGFVYRNFQMYLDKQLQPSPYKMVANKCLPGTATARPSSSCLQLSTGLSATSPSDVTQLSCIQLVQQYSLCHYVTPLQQANNTVLMFQPPSSRLQLFCHQHPLWYKSFNIL
jgi:hypothetical protein